MIYRFRDRFTVEELCKLLEVSRSGYYKWLKRKDKPDRDKIVADLIAECHEKAHRTYGYRRVKIWAAQGNRACHQSQGGSSDHA